MFFCYNLSMQIISVSRRTDIPAFYGKWFMERVKEGFACYRNPFNGQGYKVSLKQEDVIAFVFWSKNFRPFLKYLDRLDTMGYRFYFHFTINGHPRELEEKVPPYHEMVKVAHELAARYSPLHVIWRFDPMVISSHTSIKEDLERFASLTEKIAGATFRCYFSFAEYYSKVKRNLALVQKNHKFQFVDPPIETKLSMVREMVKIADPYNITLHGCCQDLLAGESIQKAHCIDGEIIKELYPEIDFAAKLTPTRKGCGCYQSRDIGAYDTCPHGCAYCYANADKERAFRRFQNHNHLMPFI